MKEQVEYYSLPELLSGVWNRELPEGQYRSASGPVYVRVESADIDDGVYRANEVYWYVEEDE